MKDVKEILKFGQNGITLIALVITIIVLLILAGITVNTLMGNNGILNQANKAKIETERAEIEEMLKLAVTNMRIEYSSTSEHADGETSFNDYFKERETFEEKADYDTNEYVIPPDPENGEESKTYEYIEDVENNETYVELEMYKESGTRTLFKFKISLPSGGVEYLGQSDDIKGTSGGKITFELNGGKFENEDEVIREYKLGKVVGFISPIQDGFAFDGWYLDSNCTEERVSSTEGLNGDITVYAKWLQETSSEYFTYDDKGTTITGFAELGIEAFKNESKTDLVIPKKHNENAIIAIDYSAFTGEKLATNSIVIKKLVIPNNITKISSAAFANCAQIQDLTIPISIHAGEGFSGCTGIKKINITKGNGEGINYSFGDCSRLPWYQSRQNELEITLEEGITRIGDRMFYSCTGLKHIKFPTSLKEIGELAFQKCTQLQEISSIEGLTKLSSFAFDGCTELTGTIVMPKEITEILGNVFSNTKIEKLVIPDNITKIDYNAFANCAQIQDLTIPISIHAGEGFSGCTGIKKINITKGNGEGINYSFGDCSRLPWYQSRQNELEITLEEGITKIGNYMFCNCTGIVLVKFPKTLTEIGPYAFYNINNATYDYAGSQQDWEANVTVNNNNTSLDMQRFNFHE